MNTSLSINSLLNLKLTLTCACYFSPPFVCVCVGGVHLDLGKIKYILFRWTFHHNTCILENLPFQNGGQSTDFILRIKPCDKIWKKKKKKKKNTFPKKFFNEILGQIWRKWLHLHCWNKVWKKNRFKMAVKTVFSLHQKC